MLISKILSKRMRGIGFIYLFIYFDTVKIQNGLEMQKSYWILKVSNTRLCSKIFDSVGDNFVGWCSHVVKQC
jgi:hypothetical protein